MRCDGSPALRLLYEIPCGIAVLRERSPIAWLDCNTLKSQRNGSTAPSFAAVVRRHKAKVISLRKS